jgi:hypothetical protein
MSTGLGLAAVTAVLKNILNNGITEANLAAIVGSNVTISSLPPDRVSIAGANDPNQLNIFLYQTSYNAAWRNVGFPSRNAAGDRISNPPMALNLHYILSAYGAQDFYAEIILGYGMQALHENPVMPRGAITAALSPPLPPGQPKQLLDSRLAEQIEQITVTPESLTTEEISRLWTALGAHYRPSAAYQVTVVLVQPARSAMGPLPAASRTLTGMPFAQIVIEQILPATGEGTPILPTSTLVIKGQNLRGDDTRLLIGGTEFIPDPTTLTATQITFPLPGVLPAGFYAGLLGVQIVHEIQLGSPTTAHPIFKSPVLGMALRPAITALPENLSSTVIDSITYRAGDVKVTFTPNVGRNQDALLLLNEFNPPSTRPARAYSFAAPPDNGIALPATPDTPTIQFPFKNVLPGTYLVRVQVDGAESVLSLVAGVYTNPQVTI